MRAQAFHSSLDTLLAELNTFEERFKIVADKMQEFDNEMKALRVFFDESAAKMASATPWRVYGAGCMV